MPNTNIAIIEGHLGKDPEAKELKGGVIVCNFTIATSIGKDEKQKTQWHNCKVFGSQATDLAMNGHKGDVVSLKGRIEYRKWEEKWFTEIIVDHLHLTPKKGKSSDDGWEKE